MKRHLLILGWLAVLLAATPAKAQGLLNRIKQKAADAAEKVVDKKTDQLINGNETPAETTGSTSNGSYESGNDGGLSGLGTSASRSRPANKGGAGLITTAPDVKENLSAAEASFKAANYGESRASIQQAMLGVEMEIGRNLLKSLPETIAGLPKMEEADKVSSTSWGWNGLTIFREYLKDDKQLTITISNNSLLMSSYNAIMAAGGFAQSTDQNWKQIRVKDLKGIAEYDESSGYKITVPLGQSSLIVWEGVNFNDEQEIMAAVNAFDLNSIKKTLGEN